MAWLSWGRSAGRDTGHRYPPRLRFERVVPDVHQPAPPAVVPGGGLPLVPTPPPHEPRAEIGRYVAVVKAERRGRIVLLNGASSSGKSSIGRALQRVLADPWFFFPVDALGAMRSTEHTRVLEAGEIEAMLRRTRMGYHRAVAGVASVGNDVIMDYPLSEPWRLADLLDVLEGYDVTLVDVHCDPDELDRREHARGDRPVGLARSQRVFRHEDRDITVDTTHTSPEACANAIADGLAALGADKAFDRLRRLRS